MLADEKALYNEGRSWLLWAVVAWPCARSHVAANIQFFSSDGACRHAITASAAQESTLISASTRGETVTS